jgi:hypothetical protein
MKKLISLTLLSASALLFVPIQTIAGTKPTTELSDPAKETERANGLLNRLNEIKALDKSTLTRTERKELRKELRSTKAEMKQSSSGGGIYLSVGAIIIIILLLIILL